MRAIPLASLALLHLRMCVLILPLSRRGPMNGERFRDGERGYGVETKVSSRSSRANAKASVDTSVDEKKKKKDQSLETLTELAI
ncbi:hypothetical protein EDB86DRAFT_2935464, partial [Lactarius hatsudake]